MKITNYKIVSKLQQSLTFMIDLAMQDIDGLESEETNKIIEELYTENKNLRGLL